MKKIKLEYIELSEKNDNSIIKISTDYPLFKKERICYLFELYSIQNLEDLIESRNEELLIYGIINNNFFPFFISVDENTFEEIQKFLKNETLYEVSKWQDKITLLNVMIDFFKKDIKFWET